MYQFRLPTTELNRGFRKWGFTSLLALILAHFFLPKGISGELLVLVAAIGVGGYFYVKQYVWLTLSTEGIAGTGYTNRKIQISWRDAVTINKARVSDMDGFEIRASENDGVLRKQVLSVFIPRAIAETPEFLATVTKVAPTNHPLRTLSGNAP